MDHDDSAVPPGKKIRLSASQLIFLACGIWLIGIGVYFTFLRPSLLPEDLRYMGTGLSQIRSDLPGLEGWLHRVFGVMGGFMAGAGALTIFVAVTAPQAKRTGLVLALVGLITVGTMSVTNFALGSDFRWLLLIPLLLWLAGVVAIFHQKKENNAQEPTGDGAVQR